jgi:hypothetical protein
MNNEMNKKQTSQEWELQRWENNNQKWSRLKKSWADWKLQNPNYVKAKALAKLEKQLALDKKRWGPKAK